MSWVKPWRRAGTFQSQDGGGQKQDRSANFGYLKNALSVTVMYSLFSFLNFLYFFKI